MVRMLFKYKVKIVALVAVAVFMFCLWSFCIWGDDISLMLRNAGEYLRDNISQINNFPMFVYAFGTFLLPLFFLPVTPVYFLASARAVDGSTFMVALAYCYVGVLANMAFSYFLARRFGRFLRSKLAARGIHVPEVPRYEQYEFTFLMRMIPGNPLVVQNYVLGLADIPFDRYMLVSIAVQFVQIAAYVYLGEAIFEGGMSKIFLGVSVVGVLCVAAAMLKKAYGYKLKASGRGRAGRAASAASAASQAKKGGSDEGGRVEGSED